jgi:hypothetical protein
VGDLHKPRINHQLIKPAAEGGVLTRYTRV